MLIFSFNIGIVLTKSQVSNIYWGVVNREKDGACRPNILFQKARFCRKTPPNMVKSILVMLSNSGCEYSVIKFLPR